MAKLIMYTGGARSGKSEMAQARLKNFKPVCYIATGEALDAEMQSRIQKHKLSRPAEWLTIEEPLNLCAAIQRANKDAAQAILIDCLTLWLSNRMLETWRPGWSSDDENEIVAALKIAISELQKSSAKECVVVTNEVGCGIVPVNEMSRAFRDLTGRANQILAAGSDEVFLTSAGLSVKLK